MAIPYKASMNLKRKFCFAILFLVISASLSCSHSQVSILPKPDEIILEIVSTTSDMVYPKGDILIMRLYRSGRFEYDDYPNYNPPTTRNATTTKKEAELNSEDVVELIKLANQPDFLSAEKHYPELRPNTHIDAFVSTKIKFNNEKQTKFIEAENFWDILSYPEARAKYPPSMIKLLERAKEMKAKVIGKTLDKYL